MLFSGLLSFICRAIIPGLLLINNISFFGDRQPEEVGLASHQNAKNLMIDSDVINRKVSQEMFDSILREVVEETGVPARFLVSYIGHV